MRAKTPPLDNVVKIPRGKICFPDLEEKARAKRTGRRWEKYGDPWFNEGPPVPEPLTQDEQRFLTNLKWSDPYHTCQVLDLRTELSDILTAMASRTNIQQKPPGEPPKWEVNKLLHILEIETLSAFCVRLFKFVSIPKIRPFLSLVIGEIKEKYSQIMELSVENFLMATITLYLRKYLENVETLRFWDEIRLKHLGGVERQVAAVAETWADHDVDVVLLLRQEGVLIEFEEQLGAFYLLPTNTLLGTLRTIPNESVLVNTFLTFVAQCEERYVLRHPPEILSRLLEEKGRRWRTLEEAQALLRFTICTELVWHFVDKTPLSTEAMDRLAWLLATRLNAISPMNWFLRRVVGWNKIILPKQLEVTLGAPELGVSPIQDYFFSHVFARRRPRYTYSLNLEPRERGLDLIEEVDPTLFGKELTSDPERFQVIFNLAQPFKQPDDYFLFFTMPLSSHAVVNYLKWVTLDDIVDSYYEERWDDVVTLLKNRDVEAHVISQDPSDGWFRPHWKRIILRLRPNEPTELIFIDPTEAMKILRVDPGFEPYLAQAVLTGWSPDQQFTVEQILAMLEQGFSVQGWLVRYRPEDYHFFMEKYGVRIPVIGGLHLANLLVGCFPPKDLTKYVQYEVELFREPVWFAIGGWRFQFTPNTDPPFVVTFNHNNAAISQEEFFYAAKAWETLEIEGLEEDFLDGDWREWVRKFYPLEEVAQVLRPQMPEDFFACWKFYEFFVHNVRQRRKSEWPTVAKLEFDLMLQKLRVGECWFPPDVLCKLIDENDTYYVLERTSSKGSEQVPVRKEAVQQLETFLREHPNQPFTAKQVLQQKIFNRRVAPLDVVRVLVCLRKATLETPTPTKTLRFRTTSPPNERAAASHAED